MQLPLSTETRPERDRFAFFAEGRSASTGAQRIPLPDTAGPSHPRRSIRSRGPLINLMADAHIIRREARDIARLHQDAYWIFIEGGSDTRCRFAGRDYEMQTGDMYLLDWNAPFEARTQPGYNHQSWLLSKALLDRHLSAAVRSTMPRHLKLSGAGALAANYLETLARNFDYISETSMHGVADTLARLLALAVGAPAGDDLNTHGQARLIDAKRHIEHRLASPELTPASVATALRVSVRALHLLFESDQISFTRYVTGRRLERCRSTLMSDPDRSVTDIAFAWGFGSLSAFYRTFQARFGASPGELRARASRQPTRN